MLEILLLVVMCRKIGAIADNKGVKPGKWKLYVILAWFACELGVCIITMLLTQSIGLAIILGYASAIGSFFIIKNRLQQKPDVDDWIGQIGEEPVEVTNPVSSSI